MSVLLIHDKSNVAELLLTNIYVYTNQKVLTVPNLDEARQVIDSFQEIKFIITKDAIDGQNIFEEVYKSYGGHHTGYHIICLGKIELIDHYSNAISVEELDFKSIVSIIAHESGVTAADMAGLRFQDFFPFKIELFEAEKILPVSLFEYEDGMYRLLEEKGSAIKTKKLEELKATGTKFLYVDPVDRLKFLKQRTEEITKVLESADINLDTRIKATEGGIELVLEITREIGLEESTYGLIQSTKNSMEKILNDCGFLKNVYETLMKRKTSYRFLHTMMTYYLSANIINLAEYGSRQLLKKLFFITYFADVSLIDDELTRIQSVAELKRGDFSEKQIREVLNHAANSAGIIAKAKNFPMDIHVHIKQHHGARDGLGFPQKLINLSAPVLIYMMASELSILLIDSLKSDIAFSKKDILKHFRRKYRNNNQYKEYLQCVEKLKI